MEKTDSNINDSLGPAKTTTDSTRAKQEITGKPLIHSASMKPTERDKIFRKIDPKIYSSFRKDYQTSFYGAFSRAKDTVKIQSDKHSGEIAFGCTINLPGLNVYVLQRAIDEPYQEALDIVVFEDPLTKSYVLLSGERLKNSLSYGIRAFALMDLQTPGETIKKLFFDPWDNFFDGPEQTRKDKFVFKETLSKEMKRLDLKYFTETFLAPNFPLKLINEYVQGPVRTSSVLSNYIQQIRQPH